MRITFEQIKDRLEDPFFEMQTLGKEAIRQRILPAGKFGGTPDCFQFIDWTPEDDRQTIL